MENLLINFICCAEDGECFEAGYDEGIVKITKTAEKFFVTCKDNDEEFFSESMTISRKLDDLVVLKTLVAFIKA